MSNKYLKLYSSDESKAIDALAIEKLSLAPLELMSRAAKFAFNTMLECWPSLRSVTIFSGKGNNAGDAFLLARLAQDYGIKIQLVMVSDLSTLSGSARAAYDQLELARLEVTSLPAIVSGDLIVDGLLGTGLKGGMKENYAQAITLINASDVPVLSLDVPSGLNASTGAIVDTAVLANVTVTFITGKLGLYLGAGPSSAGEVRTDALGVPPAITDEFPGVDLRFFDPSELPELPLNTYKNRQGHLLIIGGDVGMPGAILMAAEAALRAGAGLVTVATRPEHFNAIASRIPEVMMVDANCSDFAKQVDKYETILIGPGLGRSNWGRGLYEVCMGLKIPTVVDADGLFWMAELGAPGHADVIISPHAGEAARLVSSNVTQVETDRLQTTKELIRKYSVMGVLKGPGSIIFCEENLVICGHGNPGMATAGMGDVLSGIIAGLAVQRFGSLAESLVHAVLLHSASADQASKIVGQRSLIATDVIRFLPKLMSP